MNGIIDEKSPTTETWKDIATDALISLIPIYGTYTEFKKGNIGWGIFSAVTDVAMLVPVLGSGLKVTGAAIRGGKAAIRAGRFADTALQVSHSPLTKTTSEAINAFYKGAAAEAAKSAPELGKAIVRAVDPGIELAYSGGKLLAKAGKGMHVVWKSFDMMNAGKHITALMENFHKSFKALLSTGKLDPQFLSDFSRCEFKINGKVIQKDTPEKMLAELEKEIPDLNTRQLLSTYANQSILADPYTRLLTENNLIQYSAENNRVLFDVVTLPSNKMILNVENTANLKFISESDSAHKSYSSYGLNINMVLSKERPAKPYYSYFINTEL